jgi:hypothetical protein
MLLGFPIRLFPTKKLVSLLEDGHLQIDQRLKQTEGEPNKGLHPNNHLLVIDPQLAYEEYPIHQYLIVNHHQLALGEFPIPQYLMPMNPPLLKLLMNQRNIKGLEISLRKRFKRRQENQESQGQKVRHLPVILYSRKNLLRPIRQFQSITLYQSLKSPLMT